MSRNMKIVLVVAGSLFALCTLACIAVFLIVPRLAENAFTQDPQKAKQVAAQIADYTLPAGYSEQFSMDILTTKMVMIQRNDRREGLVIMLMQVAAAGTTREQMEAQMRQSFQSQFQQSTGALTPVGTEQVTIKGQPVTLTISEGRTTSGDLPVRQAIGTFVGRGGTAMLMIYGPQADWDKTVLASFYASIK